MADSTIKRGRDTHVRSDKPDRDFAQTKHPLLKSGNSKIFVFLPMPGIRKKAIEQAILSVPVKDAWAAQTLTATPLDEAWVPRQTTWNNQPALRAGAVSDAQAAKSDGQRVSIDVTAYVQTVANGAKHFGWQITTGSSAENRIVGFDAAGNDSWKLTIDFVEAPEPPSDLYPNGEVVEGKPLVTFDFVDLGGESSELDQVRVLVNSSASTSGAWDSTWRDTVTPEFDLSAWTGTPVDGSTYYYRVEVKDGAGYASDPSDWASFVYDPKPTLTIDQPTGGLVWDPSPTILFGIDSGAIKVYRVRVFRDSDDAEVYDSGRLTGSGTTDQAHTIPFKQHGKRVLRDDQDYRLQVRVWDRHDRKAPAWTQATATFHLDDDATPAAPSGLEAFQIGNSPRVRLTWSRAGTTDAWVVLRGGEVIARLDADEVDAESGTYAWTDSTAAPYLEHTYTVKAIDNGNGKQTTASEPFSITTTVGGVWLLSDDADVCLRGTGVENFRTLDRRASYKPLNLAYDIDIVHAFEGVVGSFSGGIEASRGEDWEAYRRRLLRMKGRPSETVQLVYGTTSVPVLLRNVSVSPSGSMLPNNMRHDVSFEAQQVDDFETAV